MFTSLISNRSFDPKERPKSNDRVVTIKSEQRMLNVQMSNVLSIAWSELCRTW